MHIALLTDGIFPYMVGGMQKHSMYLAKYLARNQVQVDLYHCHDTADTRLPSPFSEAESQFIRLTRVPFPASGRLPGHYLRESRVYSRRILHHLQPKLRQYDLIYAQGFTAWALLEAKARGLQSPPVGVNFHGLNMFQPAAGLRGRLENLMFRPPVSRNMRLADINFCLGGKLAGIIARITRREDNIVNLPVGISRDWLRDCISPTGSGRRFLFIGRYNPLKAIPRLNRAISMILEQAPAPFSIDFIGPIPPHARLRSLAITYHGELRDEFQIRNIMQRTDAVVSTSISEGMPTAILEAMAAGNAVISTDVGAIREMVQGNGILIPSPAPALISRALRQFLELPPETVDSYKQRSQELIRENFLWEEIIQKTIEAFGKFV